MSNTATRLPIIDQPLETLPAEEPSIEPQMAQILDLAKKNNSSLTPREINEHLSRILQSYDELTAIYAKNSLRIDSELDSVRQAGSTVSSQLQQVNAELSQQGSALATLAGSTKAEIESVQHQLQGDLKDVQERVQEQFTALHASINQDVSRLGAGIASLDQLMQAQEHIIGEQSSRLDQFDAAYELLDTATRGNRKRIEAVREETQKQHTILAAQVQGLAALQREHYNEFNEVRTLVGALETQTQRLDSTLQTVASDLVAHVEGTQKTFKWTHGALAGLLLLTMGGFALVKWAPAFAPASTENSVAQSAENIAEIKSQLVQLPSLELRSTTQESQIGQLESTVTSLQDSIGGLKKSIGRLNTRIAYSEAQAVARQAGGVPLLDGHWVRQQNPKAYTVQLMGVGSPNEMSAFISQNAEFLADARLAYTVTQPAGRNRYNLFYGVFENAGLARAALQAMPAALHGNKPWVRQFKAVQSVIE